MIDEKKDENVEEEEEEQPEEGYGHRHGGHYGWHRRGHLMRRRMWMNFAFMPVEEEVKLLESVKERLEKRLAIVNERLTKLKA